jgi:transposase
MLFAIFLESTGVCYLLTSVSNTLNAILASMQNADARKLSSEAQQNNRNQAIRLLDKGKSRVKIADILGVHYVTVCNWIRRFERDGKSGLAIGQRGHRSGEGRMLTSIQEAKLKQIICDKNSQQMKLPFALWTSAVIQDLVWNLWHIRIARRTVSTYLKRWGFTPQKPAKRAYEQCRKSVPTWLNEEHPFIKKRAKLFGGEIYMGDETGVRNQCQHTQGFAPKGKTPIIKTQTKRLSLNMISAITNQGAVRFMTYRETMTVKVLLRFFKRLIKDAKRKVFMILDNLRVHHAHLVRD